MQVNGLIRPPRALGVPYRGRMGKRDALAELGFSAHRLRAAGNARDGSVLAFDRFAFLAQRTHASGASPGHRSTTRYMSGMHTGMSGDREEFLNRATRL